MATLFDSLKIGDLELKNRIFMAPMTRSRANEDGVQPSFSAEYYSQRATAGLIISEATTISPAAKGYLNIPGIYSPAQIESWKKITDAVHKAGGKIFLQLFHAGRVALPDFLPDGELPLAPSPVRANGQNYTLEGPKDFVVPREMTIEDIRQTVKDFADGAANALEAGFDGVELHGANGYLIHQFLGTNTNLRTDEYGGSYENKARFLFEVIEAVSERVGSGRLGVKLSPGVKFNDMQDENAEEFYSWITNRLNGKGLAYLHIGFEILPDEAVSYHNAFRPLYDGIYIANGGYTFESGTELLAENRADAIAFGKPFLANPDLPLRFERNAELNEPDQSTFYTQGEKGYTDYPSLSQTAAA